MHDPYRILGVPVDASPAQVRRAYEDLAWAFNPEPYADLDADLALLGRAREQYRAIETAYQILADPAVREAYDRCRTPRQRRRFPRTWKKLRRVARNSPALRPPFQTPWGRHDDGRTTATAQPLDSRRWMELLWDRRG